MTMKEFFKEIPVLKSDRLVITQLTQRDAEDLQDMVNEELVYKYLPAFLYEKKYDDIHYVIDHLYDECLEESLILGVYEEGQFCGLAEFYGYRGSIHKISVGYRFMTRAWGRGIATETLGLMVQYLYGETDIEIITASTMPENYASAQVLRNNDFDLVVSGTEEDWGFDRPVPTDKWIR